MMGGMAEEWYYAQQGRQLGPVSIELLISMLQRRQIAASDLVWKQGMPNWAEARAIPELTPHAPVAPVSPLIDAPQGPPAGGVQQVQYLNAQGMQWDYAGFWLRFVAWIIDSVIIFIPVTALSFATGMAHSVAFRGAMTPARAFGMAGSQNLLGIAIWWLYFALMESSAYQASVGKMALGLIVTDEVGNRISFGRATGRTFAKYISGLIIYIGYMMAGWTEKKQGLHDMLARTLVVRRDVNRPYG